jgi:hypothetical protein
MPRVALAHTPISLTPGLQANSNSLIHNFDRGNELGLNQHTKGSNTFFVLQHLATFPSFLNM